MTGLQQLGIAWGLLVLGSVATRAEGDLEAARAALREGIPQVAILKLQRVLGGTAEGDKANDAALLLLAEAQRASGNSADALKTLLPLGAENEEATLLRADILASAGQWDEALATYRAVGPSRRVPARLGEAESLQALGRTHEAIAVLEPWMREGALNVAAQLRLATLYVEAGEVEKARAQLRRIKPVRPADRLWHRYVQARLVLLEQRFEAALEGFEEVLSAKENLHANLLAAATLGVAECWVSLSGWESADKPLEKFLWGYPDNPWIELIFRRLDQIYAQQRRPSEGELQKWADRPETRRAALAHFHLARLQIRARKNDKAMATVASFIDRFPDHRLAPSVHIMRADLFRESSRLAKSVAALEAAERLVLDDAARGEIELRKGLVQYQQGEFVLAAASLDRAAEKAPHLHGIAFFNAALAWLNQGNDARFKNAMLKLRDSGPEKEWRGSLLLEKGLVQARSWDGRASRTLARFVREFPVHRRIAEARLALAELALEGGDAGGAAVTLAAANAHNVPSNLADEADYFAIFLADQADGDVLALAQAFLRKHTKSPFVGAVRLKLGEIFFRQRDLPNAETQFATLARESPESDLAEKALFLAGQSAMQMIDPTAVGRALEYFDEVAQRRGALALYAREQQAILQARLGKEREAITLYEVILAADPPADPELRFAALCGKGDNLLALGRTDRQQIELSLPVFGEVARSTGAALHWRNQALYKKAKALEQLGEKARAGETFYDLLEQTLRATPLAGGLPQRDFFWFYKGGFDAARTFEQQADWGAAIAIYGKIAQLEGPRAAEARNRAKQLRLEHFIWE